jgi:hypothetical protein
LTPAATRKSGHAAQSGASTQSTAHAVAQASRLMQRTAARILGGVH